MTGEDRSTSYVGDLSLHLSGYIDSEVTEDFALVHEFCLLIIERRRGEIDSCEEGFPFFTDVRVVCEREYSHILGVIFFLGSATRICSLQEVVVSCPYSRNDPDIRVNLDVKSILMRIIQILTMSDS